MPIQNTAADISGSFIRYLPAVYQDNDFLRRYLALFENLYLDIEQRIEAQPARYDPALAEPDALRFLADCVAWPEPELWPPERLRAALPRAGELYAARGTPGGVAIAVELYTGQTPYIVEHFAWNDARFSARPPALFSDCPYSFSVILTGQRSEAEYRRICRVVQSFSPAHTTARVVCLTPCFLLDGHSYLDCNAMLTAASDTACFGEAHTDEKSLFSLV